MTSRAELVHCTLLDPRPACDAHRRPIQDAANIPHAELPRRTHELPPRDEPVRVAARLADTPPTVEWLTRAGRRPELADAWVYAPTVWAGVQIPRLWRPSRFLEHVLAHIPSGRALDLACGCGRDAVYMASRGWRVTGVDHLPDALARAADLAARCAPAIEPVEWRRWDLRSPARPPWTGLFDLIVCVRFLHRPMFERLAEWLAPGAHVVCELFTAHHRRRHGHPASDRHVLEPGELERLLSGLKLVEVSEDWVGSSHVARAWAMAR